MIGASNVGILLDIWDLHVSGGSPDNVRGLSAEQIVAVQLADVPADGPPTAELTEASRTLPAEEGGIDLPAYLVALAETGYDGPVTFVPHRKALTGRRRDPIVRQVAGALDRIWKAAGLTPDGKLAAPAES